MDFNVRKVGLIVGHTKKSPGANVVSTIQSSEYFYNRQVAEKLEDIGAVDLVVYRDGIGIAGACKAIVESDVDLSIELHCNAANVLAVGCEALYYTNASKKIATIFCTDLCHEFKRKNRGAKYVVENGRGILNLQLLSDIPYSILVEPFFGDNPNDYIEVEDYVNFLKAFIAKIRG